MNEMKGTFELTAAPYGTTWKNNRERLKIHSKLCGTDNEFVLIFEGDLAVVADRMHKGDRISLAGSFPRYKPKYDQNHLNVMEIINGYLIAEEKLQALEEINIALKTMLDNVDRITGDTPGLGHFRNKLSGAYDAFLNCISHLKEATA